MSPSSEPTAKELKSPACELSQREKKSCTKEEEGGSELTLGERQAGSCDRLLVLSLQVHGRLLGLGQHVEAPAAHAPIGGDGDEIVRVLRANDIKTVDGVGVGLSCDSEISLTEQKKRVGGDGGLI